MSIVIAILTVIATALAVGIIHYRKKCTAMSQEFEKLKADVLEAKSELTDKNQRIASLEAQVEDLTSKLAAAQGGTPDADIAALDAELKPALDPAPAPGPAPEPAPEPAPAPAPAPES